MHASLRSGTHALNLMFAAVANISLEPYFFCFQDADRSKRRRLAQVVLP
jgi:hypothetical protein